jgi:hypothetical protein
MVRAAIAIPSVQRHWPAAERNATGLIRNGTFTARRHSKKTNKQTKEQNRHKGWHSPDGAA